MVAISASVQPASASRVTAVPRKSWNVRPTTPARLHALPHDALKPSDVHGLPSLLVKMIVLRFGVASSTALNGAPTGTLTRAPSLLGASGWACRHRPTTEVATGRLVAGRSIAASLAADTSRRSRIRSAANLLCFGWVIFFSRTHGSTSSRPGLIFAMIVKP